MKKLHQMCVRIFIYDVRRMFSLSQMNNDKFA